MAVINGTEGSNFLLGTAEDDQIFGFGGGDTLLGLGGDDSIEGGTGNDTLTGGDGHDTLVGGDGNDTLAGDAGADSLTGGAGSDRFSLRISPSFFAPTDSTPLAQDTITDFEGAGIAGGDTLQLTESSSRRMVLEGALAAMPAIGESIGFGGNGFTEVFYAFDGGDTVVFADTNDDGVFDAEDFAIRLSGQHALVAEDFGTTPFVMRGTDGNDVLAGTDGNDTIFALGGNDTVSGGNGNDSIDGGDGNDLLSGDAGNDVLQGGSGNDTLLGGNGTDRITGGDGNDFIDGGAGRDTVLAGGDGNDQVFGGAGDDTLDGDDGNDVLDGGADEDVLFGGDGDDILLGGDDDDELFGMDGDDRLSGGAGDDEIVGEGGADRLEGGAGDDEFRFFQGTFNPSSIFAAPDTVLDFEGAGVEGGDEIDLDSLRFVFRGEQDIDLAAGAPLAGGGNGLTDLAYTRSGGDTWLVSDDNDNGILDGDDTAIAFKGNHDFTEQDFARSTDFVIAGTDGNDILVGTEEDDIIYGLGGDDVLVGGDGSDELNGGSGNDELSGGPGFGFDVLNGDEGDDRLSLVDSDLGGVAFGGSGNDLLVGSDAPFSLSQLVGDDGDDDLHAGTGAAQMDGGTGADRLVSGAGNDQLSGGRDASFALDGARDLFVYGAGPWGSDRIVQSFEDGFDLFDLRESGLQFGDLEIVDAPFRTTIISSLGQIDIFERFDEPVEITEADFLFA